MHVRSNAWRAAVVAALAVAASASLGDRLPDFKECIKVWIYVTLRRKLFRVLSQQTANINITDMYGD
jgi:hypothetical protein